MAKRSSANQQTTQDQHVIRQQALAKLDTQPTVKIGRPSVYQDDFPDRIVKWFRSAPLPFAQSPDSRESVQMIYASMPTFEAFGDHIGVSTQTLWRWERMHPPFGEACSRARDIQRRWFIAGLTTGAMNPTGGIFVSKNIIGWREKIDVEQTTTTIDGTPLMAQCLAVATEDEREQLRSLLATLQQRVQANAAINAGNAPAQLAIAAPQPAE